MKSVRPILIRVSLLAVGVGFVLSLGALIGLKFDFTRLYTQEVYPISRFSPDPFRHISIDVSDCNVRFVPSEDGMYRVDCPETSSITYSVYIVQDTLMVEEEDHGAWYTHIGIAPEPRELVVHLPQQAYETLEVKTVSGDITLNQDFSFVNAYLSTTSGTLQCSSAVSGDASVETVSGDVDITGWTLKSLQGQSTSGVMRLYQVDVDGICHLDSVSGNVQLVDCDAQSMILSTVSGDISASLCTDKTFSAQTVSGNIQVPTDTSGDPCQVSTVSGDITCTIQ